MPVASDDVLEVGLEDQLDGIQYVTQDEVQSVTQDEFQSVT
jgi:hypothetical protein